MKKPVLTVAMFPLIARLLAQQAQPPAQDGGGRGPSAAIQQRVQPPARITKFTAEPDGVKPGESSLLTWATENPTATSIEPGIGRVTARGTVRVSPAATTTYTLTVSGPNGSQTRTVTVNVAGAPSTSATSTVTSPRVIPRMPDGKPDFSGVYDFRGPAGTGGPAGAGGRAGGRAGRAGNTPSANTASATATPQLKAGAEKFRVVRGPQDTGADSNCMPLAGPNGFGVPYQFQIVQGANTVAILHEYPGTFRTIPINGVHPTDPDPTWMGDSVARWEGDTLVVDTVGFNDKTEISGFRHSEALHIVEHFSRPDLDTLQYQANIEDPNVFEGPFVVNRVFALRPDLAKVGEFVCENNRDYTVLFKN